MKPQLQCHSCSSKLQREVGKGRELELSWQSQSSDSLKAFTLPLATEIHGTHAKFTKMRIFSVSIIDKVIGGWSWWFLSVCTIPFYLNELFYHSNSSSILIL